MIPQAAVQKACRSARVKEKPDPKGSGFKSLKSFVCGLDNAFPNLEAEEAADHEFVTEFLRDVGDMFLDRDF